MSSELDQIKAFGISIVSGFGGKTQIEHKERLNFISDLIAGEKLLLLCSI